MPELRISNLVEESIVDGPGLRFVVFTQGCLHFCKGCHNPKTHRLDGGELVRARDIIAQFKDNPLLSGITLSGGEPFLQPGPLCLIASSVKAAGKTVVTYTGYTYERLYTMAARNLAIKSLLMLTDILIDGPYIEEQRNLELQFQGSTNQRVLTLQDRFAIAASMPPASLAVFAERAATGKARSGSIH